MVAREVIPVGGAVRPNKAVEADEERQEVKGEWW